MAMRYQNLGPSGLRVSELALGTMTFGDEWGWGANREEADAQFDAFREAGGNFIDTADVYTGGTAEKWVGERIAGDRDRYVIGTKYTLATGKDPNRAGNQRKNMHRAIKESLDRLQTDHVDLYWVHAWDARTPSHEVLRGLDDLVRQGRIHHIGISDAPAWVVSRLVTLAEERDWPPVIAVQLQYGLSRRTPERELLPMAEHLGLGVTAWGTLGRGILTGKYLERPPAEGGKRRLDVQAGTLEDDEVRLATVVQETAKELGATPAQVATRWILDRPGSIIPILGATRAAQLQDTLKALTLDLGASHRQRLDEASAITSGFPTDFVSSPRIQKMIGSSWDETSRQARPRWR